MNHLIIYDGYHVLSIIQEYPFPPRGAGGAWTNRKALGASWRLNISFSQKLMKIEVFRRSENGIHRPLMQHR